MRCGMTHFQDVTEVEIINYYNFENQIYRILTRAHNVLYYLLRVIPCTILV